MKNKGFRLLLRAVLCLIVGLLFGVVALTAITWLKHPEESIFHAAETAMAEGLLPLLTGGVRDGILALLGRAAPTTLLALGVSLAW